MAFFTALAIAGLATDIYGTIKSGQAQAAAGQAQQAAADSQAAIDTYNAGIAKTQAEDATEIGAQTEDTFRASVRGAIGAQRTGAAAENVDVGFGSPVDVQGDAAFLGELDALQIRTNAARTAWGYQVQGANLTAEAAIATKTGQAEAAAGETNEATTDISGLGSTLLAGANLAYKYAQPSTSGSK